MTSDAADLAVPRVATHAVHAAMRVFPVVAITGARQTGKSTLLAAPELAAGRTVISLDDSAARTNLVVHSDSILQAKGGFILDEIQREPELVLALKRAVDAMGTRRQRGKYLVTGSANLLLMKRVSDSLAGRAGYVTLWPMCRRERLGLGTTGAWNALFAEPFDRWADILAPDPRLKSDWRAEVRRGGFPEPSLQLTTEHDRARWFDGYIDTYLDRDLRDISAVTRLADFRRFMTAAAVRIGQVADQTSMGRDIQQSQQVVRNWLNLLETTYQIVRVPAFTASRGARVVKSPKLYWSDVALGFHLAGDAAPTGFHLENFILGDLLAWSAARTKRAQVLHWRTTAQVEVDFVIEAPEGLVPIEVKASRRVGLRDAEGLLAFARHFRTKVRGGLLLYDGDEVLSIAPGVLAVPWWTLA